jgi:CRISPR/Cas system-associated endonuclease Cas1
LHGTRARHPRARLRLPPRAQHPYFSAWAGLATGFSERDLAKVPHHWRGFDRRLSSLTNFRVARTAATPIDALLNYGYAIAEAECRMACHQLGLDPGLGILHVDRNNRDSLALDLLEAVRPDVDRHVLRMVFERSLRASTSTKPAPGNAAYSRRSPTE